MTQSNLDATWRAGADVVATFGVTRSTALALRPKPKAASKAWIPLSRANICGPFTECSTSFNKARRQGSEAAGFANVATSKHAGMRADKLGVCAARGASISANRDSCSTARPCAPAA